MVTQIRNILEQYRDKGGHVQFEMFEGSGHGPVVDAAERWSGILFAFLAAVERAAHAGAAQRAD
jgi:hypothetical protein